MARPEILDRIDAFTAPTEAEIAKLPAAKAEEKAAEALDLVTDFFDAQDSLGDDAVGTEQKQKIISLNKLAEDLAAHVKDQAEFESAQGRARQLKDGLNTPVNGLSLGAGSAEAERLMKSVGQMFVESEQYKNLLKHGETFGTGEASKFGQVGIEVKTLVTGLSDTSAGVFVQPDQRGTVDQIRRELSVLDLVTRGTTTSDVVEYVIESAMTNNAAVVAEATSAADGASPESAIGFTKTSTNVKEISHFIPVTRRALADAGQVRTYIDSALRYGVLEALEAQVLNGDGLGENFTGITNVSGTTAQAFDTDILTTTRKARTKAKTTGRVRPSGILMTPDNWEEIDLLKDSQGRYYYGGPANLGTPRLWGLPVVESEILAANTAVLADFRHAYLLDREQTQILASDSNSDWFIRKIIALLAIGRFAFYVQRPAGFVEATLTGA